jgi:hypothetical protein
LQLVREKTGAFDTVWTYEMSVEICLGTYRKAFISLMNKTGGSPLASLLLHPESGYNSYSYSCHLETLKDSPKTSQRYYQVRHGSIKPRTTASYFCFLLLRKLLFI